MEAGCELARDQGYAQVSHPGPGGLPQVRVIISTQAPYVLTDGRIVPWPCRYNKLCGSLRSFAHRLSLLPAQDPFRSKMEDQLLSKLYDMGVLNTSAKLSDIENKLTVAAFCRRRLAVIMCMAKMAETVSAVRTLSFTYTRSNFPISNLPAAVARPAQMAARAADCLSRANIVECSREIKLSANAIEVRNVKSILDGETTPAWLRRRRYRIYTGM